MPVCPHCKTQQARRRLNACPGCGKPIQVVDGEWIAEYGDISPSTVILNHFCDLVSEQQSARAGCEITYRIPRRGNIWRREIHIAQALFVEADSDMELALKSLNRLFTDPQFAWRSRNSLLLLRRDYSLSLAIERGLRTKRAAQADREAHFFDSVSERAQIFSD